MAIELELNDPLDEATARRCLETQAGVRVVDDRENNRFPEPMNAAGGDDVLVGRIRNHPDIPDDRGLLLFACGDQLRKGAAYALDQNPESTGWLYRREYHVK